MSPELPTRERVHDRFTPLAQHRPCLEVADLLNGASGAKILRSDQKDHMIDKLESVSQHQLLHFTIVAAAPVRPRQKRPADLDFAALGVVTVKSGRANDATVGSVERDKCAGRFQCFTEEIAKDFLLMPIASGVLLPYQRIASDRVQTIEIFWPQRIELYELSSQRRL